MANQEQLTLLLAGVSDWNRWRATGAVLEPDLSRIVLTDVSIRGADLYAADLSGAILINADLYRCNLNGANLRGADLTNAYLGDSFLKGAHIEEANLTSATLSGADLRKATLNSAILTRANLSGARLSGADLTNADLRGARLENAILVDTVVDQATFTECVVYGLAAWNLKGMPRDQSNLIISPDDEPTFVVDDLEIAQFMHLLTNHQNLRKAINSVTERGVLLLGRFGGGGIDVLRAIADECRKLKYLPIIFDFPRPTDRNYTETVKTLAGLARFVVVDLSGPSVPQKLYATVPHFKIPFVPILQVPGRPYAMFADILEYDWVLKPVVEFRDIDELVAQLPSQVVAPAEQRLEKRKALLDELFGKQ